MSNAAPASVVTTVSSERFGAVLVVTIDH
ncbi:MAG: hypothetical protein JWQ88_382, partial [Rhodoferax sp.]|nr:hypothetical protein [Rhodoferax sp.]